MRTMVVGAVLAVGLTFGLAGCGGGNKVELDTGSTIRFDSKRDEQPKILGPGGAMKGKKGGGAQAPP